MTDSNQLSLDPIFDPQPLEEILDLIQPLDLIFFRGTDLVSATICTLQEMTTGEGYWSHVGILVNSEILPEVPELIPGDWYVWESTMSGNLPIGTDGVLDVETNKGYFGVQLRRFHDVVKNYSSKCGMVGWSQLQNNPWNFAHKRKDLIKKIRKIYYRYYHTRYNYNPIALAASVIPFLRCLRPGMQDFDDFGSIDAIEPKEPKFLPAEGHRAIDMVSANYKGKTPLDEEFDIDDLEYSDDDLDDPVIYRNPTFAVTKKQLQSMLTLVSNHYADNPEKTGFIRQLEMVVGNSPPAKSDKNEASGSSSARTSSPREVFDTTLQRNIRSLDHDYEILVQKHKDDQASIRSICDSLDRYHFDGKLFCSEMVAKFYIILGIIPQKYDHRNVIPTDFYSGLDADGMPAICNRPVIIF